ETRETEVQTEAEAMVNHYRALLQLAPGLRELEAEITRTREQSEALRAALAEELADPAVCDPARLRGKRVALLASRLGPVGETLQGLGASVELVSAADLDGPALQADLIILDSAPTSAATQGRLQQYIGEGGGVLVVGGAPYYMAQKSTDLRPIALWLGAEQYGNWGNEIVFSGETALTAALEPDESLRATKGAGALLRPLGALPILTARDAPHVILAQVRQYGEGRAGFFWTLAVADGMQDARGQVLLRMLAWLAGP
ncbi:MAG TPA: hypothetical protein VM283_10115, partial [Armatimonadota bacterium]|nr:hypothetical protein [Armatimonadota bacterium]